MDTDSARNRTGARTGAANCVGAGKKPAMFKILELKGAVSGAAEVGRSYPTREDALVALKKYLKTFKISG